MTVDIGVVGYDPHWPALYEDEKRRILGAIADLTVAIEHIGSTAVQGLAAKPIIDIMAGVRRLGDASRFVGPLEAIDYEYVPQYEVYIPERRYFRKPRTRPRTHHLHVVEMTSEFWRKHLLFRDILRRRPEVAREYAQVKRTLAARYGSDGFGYAEAKAPFIESVLARVDTYVMKATVSVLRNTLVSLEPANDQNVETLIQWTMDPVAQGPYKHVPEMTRDELRVLFLQDPDRQYFLVRRTADGKPLGRFYHRAWRFAHVSHGTDWELNIMIADPNERGKGYGTAAQQVVADHLLSHHETRSVFAYTSQANIGERRALEKAGFEEMGRLPHVRYPVELPSEPSVLYTRRRNT